MLRLFETGTREEARRIQNLRATGATVLEVDPETGRQYRVSALGDHFGGSLDALGLGLIDGDHARTRPCRCSDEHQFYGPLWRGTD